MQARHRACLEEGEEVSPGRHSLFSAASSCRNQRVQWKSDYYRPAWYRVYCVGLSQAWLPRCSHLIRKGLNHIVREKYRATQLALGGLTSDPSPRRLHISLGNAILGTQSKTSSDLEAFGGRTLGESRTEGYPSPCRERRRTIQPWYRPLANGLG
jgi:hypothetical protein